MRNLRFALIPLVVLPVAWVMFQGLGRDPREIPSPLVGRPASEFTLQSMDGEEVSLAGYRGRPVLVNFWASWCFECIAEHRVLMDAQARYGDSFAIVGILYQDTVADARRFLARHGDGGWPNLLDPSGVTAIDFGVSGVPESFFIDADGIVRYKQWGAVTEEAIETKLAPLLAAASAPGGSLPAAGAGGIMGLAGMPRYGWWRMGRIGRHRRAIGGGRAEVSGDLLAGSSSARWGSPHCGRRCPRSGPGTALRADSGDAGGPRSGSRPLVLSVGPGRTHSPCLISRVLPFGLPLLYATAPACPSVPVVTVARGDAPSSPRRRHGVRPSTPRACS